MIALQVIFFTSIFFIFHSYVLYPLILRLMAKNKQLKGPEYLPDDNLPRISILMAAYNEEAVMQEKIDSIFNSTYPSEKMEVWIGSDNSTDNTNSIIENAQKDHSNLHFIPFTKRQGKVNIINQLSDKTKGDILIITDANVIFAENTVFQLVKYFKNTNNGLVDSNMQNTGTRPEGISIQEKSYIAREVAIKHREALLWGSMMGPFGGCYAVRKSLFSKVPENYLVDDFYICLKVIDKGYSAINNLDAKVYEDVSNNLKDEFRRKVRIATGNFQNLNSFAHLIWPIYKGKGFSFFSHKVLRWLGPFLLLSALTVNIILAFLHPFYLALVFLHIFIYILPLLDFTLKKLNLHIIILRFATHFFSMNLALLIGFFILLK